MISAQDLPSPKPTGSDHIGPDWNEEEGNVAYD